MVLTLQLRLLPTAKQAAQLRATMRAFNAAATYAARVGFEAGLRSQPSIHRLTYYQLREKFGLSSQMAVRAIGKAVEYFARDKTVCPVFRPDGAMTYDERLMSFKGMDTVSLLTLDGRELVPLIYGEYQRQRFDRMKGQVDLVLRDGQFYLYASITVPDGAPIEPADFLGVDLGIVNLATDSDGTTHTGEAVERVRRKHTKQRRALQRRNTRGAKKKLKRIAKKESRFRRHENHCISKQIVQAAKDTARGIGVEDLTHIRERATVRRKQRNRQGGWAFAQLRAFVEYKAALAGVRVVAVDPRNTSRTCSQCGHCEKGNRKSQAEFRCLHCDHSISADFNAARNIASRAQAACKPASELPGLAA
ncbi:MAG: transposase [Acidobacteria bacterium]|nr:transposase [Acidobacteriota bacterium]